MRPALSSAPGSRWALVTSLGALVAACATTPPTPPPPAPRWPASPEPSRIIWAASFPDERAAGERPGFWRAFLDTILGLEEGPADGVASLLVRPFGLAATDQSLFVADPDGQRVVRIDWRTGAFTRLDCPQPWKMPMAVAIGTDGAVYVADGRAARVVRHRQGGCEELGAGALTRPTGLAIVGEELFVVDPPTHQVVVFSLRGELRRRFGSRGDGEGQLNFPTAVTARPDGTLLIIDALHFSVAAFSPDGTPLMRFGQPGERGGAFARPKGVAVDRRGRIYVTDAQLGVVLVFGADGRFDLAFGGSGREPYELSLPAGIAVVDDKLFVADTYNHRVEMYDVLEGAP